MATPNAELAYKVLDQIDAKPELHVQAWWLTAKTCGTAACFAGWASILSGDKPYLANPDDEYGDEYSYVEKADGSRAHVQERAMEVLGVRGLDADRLFDYDNTREHLGRYVAEIFGPRPEPTA